jgi:ABC-type molybdate transport system substrate-binding protein
MARHGDDTRQRGVASWLIAAVVAGVVALVAVIGWIAFLRSDSGAGVVDTRCTGQTRVEIVAGGAAAGVQQVADAFNATAPEARGSCLTANVSSVASTQVAAALPAGWSGQASPPPAVWVPDNPADLATVAAAAPELVAGYNDTVLASSPVVLAVAAGQAPATFPSWSDVLAGIAGGTPPTLADGASLTLALGDPRLDPATGYALESMVATGPTAVTSAEVDGAAAALSSLAGRAAVSASAAELLDDLAAGSPTFNAVPALEATIAGYNAGSATPLEVVRPAGPTAGDELTAVNLAADWVDITETEGAAKFLDFLRSPAAADLLQRAGWRVPGASPTSADGIDPGIAVTSLPPADDTVPDALAVALGLPVTPLGTSTATGGPTTTTTTP